MHKLLILEKFREPENSLFKQIWANLWVEVSIIDPEQLEYTSSVGVLYKWEDLSNLYDWIVIRSYHRSSIVRELARQFQNRWKPVLWVDVNHHAFIQDKMCDLMDLKSGGVTIPETWSDSIKDGVVMKDNWGYWGNGVSKVEDSKNHQYNKYSVHFQEFIDNDHDWRVLLCEGNPLPFIIKRQPEMGDFRTNVHQWGELTIYREDDNLVLSAKLFGIAKNSCIILWRQCAWVDIRGDKNGNFFVLEANRTPRLRLWDYTEEVIWMYLKTWIQTLSR